MRLHKGVHQSEHLDRLLRAVRIRPGNLDLYLEVMGVENVRRAVYKAGASLRIRYDERLITDLENTVGPGLVRLLGHRGATARIEVTNGASATSVSGSAPAPALVAVGGQSELDDLADLDDF